MMNYQAKREVVFNEEIGTYTTYGIVVSEKGKTLFEIHDVTTSEKEIEKFCLLCNRLELDPIHIYEAIEDNL